MPEPLRIALVSREYPPFFGGGIGTYARWIVPALVDAGCEVHVITETHEHQPRMSVEGRVTVHRVPVAMGGGGWTGAAMRFGVLAARRCSSLARRGLIDVAEFAECEAAGLATMIARSAGAGGLADKCGVGTVVHLHTPSEVLFALRSLTARTLEPLFSSYVLAERAALHMADVVCAPSEFIAGYCHEHYSLERHPTVIPYAIGPLPPRSAKSEPKRVLYVGRIEPRKGVEVLVRAWQDVVSRHPDARLRLVGADTNGAPGGGSLRAYLEQLTRETLGADDRSVQFAGKLRPEELGREYGKASVVVVPSLWENFPNTCIEAMSHARVVVAGDHGGMREMIEHASVPSGPGAGETFASGDPGSLAGALAGVLDETPAELAVRGNAARRGIADMCEPSRVAAQRIAMYREAVARSHMRTTPSPEVRLGLLDVWRAFERFGSGHAVAPPDMPAFSRRIERWVSGGTPSLAGVV